jgi:hypothetical protein
MNHDDLRRQRFCRAADLAALLGSPRSGLERGTRKSRHAQRVSASLSSVVRCRVPGTESRVRHTISLFSDADLILLGPLSVVTSSTNPQTPWPN